MSKDLTLERYMELMHGVKEIPIPTDEDMVVIRRNHEELLKASAQSLGEALERDKELRDSGELQEMMSQTVMTQKPKAGTRIDAQFLKEALEEHAKAEADGTLYQLTRPRVGMRAVKEDEEHD